MYRDREIWVKKKKASKERYHATRSNRYINLGMYEFFFQLYSSLTFSFAAFFFYMYKRRSISVYTKSTLIYIHESKYKFKK